MATIYNVGDTAVCQFDFSQTNGYLRGTAYITLNSQSVASKTSNVTVQLYLYKTAGSSPTTDTTFRGSVSIDTQSGSYSTRVDSLSTTPVKVFEASFIVSHDSDGTFSKFITATCTYGSRPVSTGSELLNLPTLMVTSTFSMSPSGTLYTGSTNLSINISTPDSSFKYTMVMRNSQGATLTLFDRISATSWSGVLPSSLNSLMPSSNTTTIYFDLITYTSNNVQLGTYTDYRTVTVGTNAGPSITNISVTAVNASNQPVAYGFIAGVSYLRITFNVTDTTGSTIVSVKSVIDNYECTATIVGTSGTIITQHPIGRSGTVTLTLIGTNARGGTGSASTSINVTAYAMPRIDILSAVRSDASGTTVPQGTYAKVSYKFSVSIIGTYNNYSYTLAYKPHTGSTWTLLKNMTDQSTADVYIQDELWSGFDANTNYDIRLQITDTLTSDNGRATKSVVMGIDQVIIDLKYDGSGIGFGKTSEDSGIADFGWFARFTGGIYPVRLTPGTSLASYKSPGYYYYSATEGGTISDIPPGLSGNYGVTILPTGVSSVLQIVVPEAVGSSPTLYLRTVSTSGQLSSWRTI